MIVTLINLERYIEMKIDKISIYNDEDGCLPTRISLYFDLEYKHLNLHLHKEEFEKDILLHKIRRIVESYDSYFNCYEDESCRLLEYDFDVFNLQYSCLTSYSDSFESDIVNFNEVDFTKNYNRYPIFTLNIDTNKYEYCYKCLDHVSNQIYTAINNMIEYNMMVK